MATAETVICGAGLDGASAAYQLAVRHRMPHVVIVDERPPMTLTSDKGTQAYRNWFDGPDDTMVRFISRSLDVLEELAESSGNTFHLSRHGYAFATADPTMRDWMRDQARRLESFGAGSVREHPGAIAYEPVCDESWQGIPDGSDLLLDAALVREHYPFLRDDTIAVSHVRRAGWLDAIRLGHWQLEEAVRHGATIVRDRMIGADTTGGRLHAVQLASGGTISTGRLVVAAGPGLPNLLGMLETDLPLMLELHGKMRFDDRLGVIPRLAPFMIWNDAVGEIDWSPRERSEIERDPSAHWLLDSFPGGIHVRPIGPDRDILLIWTFETGTHDYVWPPTFDPRLGDVLLRGLAHIAPVAAAYVGDGSRGFVDGGYYCKTPENRPLIGPIDIEGVYLCAALSGYGVMSSPGAGDLVADHVTGASLPEHAAALSPKRYADPGYRRRLEGWDAKAGQL